MTYRVEKSFIAADPLEAACYQRDLSSSEFASAQDAVDYARKFVDLAGSDRELPRVTVSRLYRSKDPRIILRVWRTIDGSQMEQRVGGPAEK